MSKKLYFCYLKFLSIKLGNLLLAKNMKIKFCDFGLASKVRFNGERKKYNSQTTGKINVY